MNEIKRDKVTVTVYHNLSPDASFGLNAVFRKGQPGEAPAEARTLPLHDGQVSWKERVVAGAERHPLVRVFVYETAIESTPEAVQALLNDLWEQFNGSSGRENETYFGRRLRSLSVGDVLVINDETGWAVESSGFRKVAFGEADVVSASEAGTIIRRRFGLGSWERLSVTVPLPDVRS